MNYLVDTNVLLRFAVCADTRHLLVRQAIRKLKQNGDELHIVLQNCIEFWNAATRPINSNGFGLSINDADFLMRLIERIFPLLPENAAIHSEWRKLVVNFGVSVVRVHDVRFVAAMMTHSVTHILTFNVSDFARYSSIGIVAVNPLTV
jgi:predicted nucleic acid-binding protein